MDEQEKKILADLNARAEQTADTILSKAIALPHTWVILVGYGLVCAFIGGIIRAKFGC